MGRNTNFNTRRRGFQGGCSFTNKENVVKRSVINIEDSPSPCANRPTIPLGPIENVDKSDKVLSNQQYLDQYKGNDLTMDLIDMKELGKIFQQLRCGKCSKLGCLRLDETRRVGLAAHFELICSQCGFKKSFSNSEERVYQSGGESHSLYPINLEYVCATRLVGVGETGANKICTYMNMNNAPSNWQPHQKVLHGAFSIRSTASKARAAEEARQDTINRFGNEDLITSNDGSWLTRGFSSKTGIVSCINVYTNKVIGSDVRHSYCAKCHGKGCEDGTKCGINYIGSSGGMEAVGAASIVLKVFQDFGLRIVKYLGDGDSKAFSSVQRIADYPVVKLECVNHVAKRMGGRMRKKKKQRTGFKLKGRKSIGGRGGLTNAAIDKIQSYYNWIIHDSKGDAKLMRKRILAMYKHIGSTNENPQHDECEDKWCKYLIAKKNNVPYNHSKHFHAPPVCMKEMEGIFEDLAKLDLLEKCALAKTQNANECFNSTVWHILPKSEFANRQLVELAVDMAVCQYNEGQLPILDVFSTLGIPIGNKMVEKCQSMDRLRVSKKRRSELESSSGKKRRKKGDKGEDYQPGLGD